MWLPVGVKTTAEDRLPANERRITFVSTLVVGFLLTSDALIRIL